MYRTNYRMPYYRGYNQDRFIGVGALGFGVPFLLGAATTAAFRPNYRPYPYPVYQPYPYPYPYYY